MNRPRLIALLTDFGNEDTYAASMKGVILSVCPTARIVDITHEISPYAISQGAYYLWSVYRHFPSGTIFVVVVDPGVGSSRRILSVQTDRYTFLAPDNGVLKYMLMQEGKLEVREISNRNYFSDHVSSTFHGRDIFAPVAGYLAKRGAISRLGKKTTPEFGPEKFVTAGRMVRRSRLKGYVISIDHFGNIISNVRFPQGKGGWKVRLGKSVIRKTYAYYGEAGTGEVFTLKGSTGLLEISMKGESAARRLRATLNQPLTIQL